MNPSTGPTERPDFDTRDKEEVSSAVDTAEAKSAAGMVSDVSSAVASAIDNTTRYLQEQGLKDVAEDVKNLVQRNPIPALLIGVGIGFLLGRATGPRI